MGTFIEAPAGRLQYEFADPAMTQGTGSIDFDIGGNSFCTLYLPVELRGVTPLTLRILLSTTESAGYADFYVIVYSMDEMTETYVGVDDWDDQRWTFSGVGSPFGAGSVWTAYKDFDISGAIAANTSHVIFGLQRLDPLGGLVDEIGFLNARTLE